MIIFLISNLISMFSSEVIISIVTAVISFVGGYIIIRERILKNELKIDSMSSYIDRKHEIINNKIKDLQEDIIEFKQLNKETSNSIIENTAAIRELKVVLDILKEQLGIKALRKIKSSIHEKDI